MYRLIFAVFLCLLQNVRISAELSAEPLFLTPYIESGRIEEGQSLSQVKPFLKGVNSHSGYLTVDKDFDSNLFFWYFPKRGENAEKAPLVLWLQGGPGASSLFGLFTENGPYKFNKGKLDHRYHSWTKYFNVIYIDNPVGVGFSYTSKTEGYATDQTRIGKNLHEALRQFLILFPDLQKNKVILSGESYAGKYVPALAQTIINHPEISPKINIYGLFIGNPFISPEHMLQYNEYLYSHGLLDKNGMQILKKREDRIKVLIKSKQWYKAADLFADTFFEGKSHRNTLFHELTGLDQHYHILKDQNTEIHYEDFLDHKSVRNALHVGSRKFNRGMDSLVFNHLKEDVMKSMKPTLEEVLKHYRVLIYTGQLDIICPYYLQENVLLHLAWDGSLEYYNSERKAFHWNRSLAGYYKTAKTLTDFMMRNSGHMVPADKPQWALGLLRRFSEGYFDPKTEEKSE